ncbi:MAG: sporulation integral membrane protein YtvI [Firmicutes bacterium]|nr:sporulation integral membrane protein YtvI [Bacillota bacterium]
MNIDKRRQFIINFVYYAIIAGVIYFSMKFLFNWLTPFIIGFLIAYAMNPLISWTVKKTHAKRSAVAYFYTITLAVILGLIVWLLVYLAIKYSQTYFYLLPDFVNKDVLPALSKINTWLTDTIANFSPDMKFQIGKLQIQLVGELQTWAINFSKNGLVFLTNITKAVPFILLTFIFTVLATVFSNVDFPNIKDFIFDIMPNKFSILVRNIKVAFKETIGKYIVAYAKIMTVTFLELSIGLTILQVPNSIFVAFLIALFDIMPVLGTGGIMVPWIAFTFLTGNVSMGVGLLILYGVITIVRQLIEPKIVGDQLGLNPLVTLISIYLGFIWLGVAGMFIVPITANIIIRLHREGNLQHFINFEELYFDEEERVARKKRKDQEKELAKKEAKNKDTKEDKKK